MNEKAKIRILIVEDHPVFRQGLRMLLQSQADLVVVGEASGAREAVDLSREEQPDIVLLDLDLSGEESVRLIPQFFESAPNCRILILTGLRDPDAHRKAVSAGASGLVSKEKAPETLLEAIRTITSGQVWFEPAVLGKVLENLSTSRKEWDEEQRKMDELTAREREVIAAVAEGLRNKEIGEKLFISETTVRHHLTSIFSKLGVSDRLELLVYAYRHGLVPPPDRS